MIDRSTTQDSPLKPMAEKVAGLLGTRVAETILASVHARAHSKVGHMDASDLIKTGCMILRGGCRPHMVTASILSTALSAWRRLDTSTWASLRLHFGGRFTEQQYRLWCMSCFRTKVRRTHRLISFSFLCEIWSIFRQLGIVHVRCRSRLNLNRQTAAQKCLVAGIARRVFVPASRCWGCPPAAAGRCCRYGEMGLAPLR